MPKNIIMGLALLALTSCASQDKSLSPERLNEVIEPFDEDGNPTQCVGADCVVFTKGHPYVWGAKLGIDLEEWMDTEPFRRVYYGQGVRLQADEYFNDKYRITARFTSKK